MSLNIEEGLTERSVSTRTDLTEKRPTRFAGKSKMLRLDSPTTIQACKELGIVVESLRPKTIEEFKDPTVEEEIIQLRFNHYFKRYNQSVKDVVAKKKEITRNQRRNEKLQQQLQQQQLVGNEGGNLAKGTVGPKGYPQLLNSTATNTGIKTSASVSNLMLPTPMLLNYNKTLSYLKNAHSTPEVKSLNDILGHERSKMVLDETVEDFDTTLANEVEKFNKIKRQKQKEAKDAFEEEMKRVKMLEELKEREKKMQEREQKLALEKKKMEEERRKVAEEKLEQIREVNRKFEDQKAEEKERIAKRLEETKQKLAQEAEERRRLKAEHEAKLEQKRRLAEEKRLKLKEEEQARCDQLKREIDNKLNHCQTNYFNTINGRMTKAKDQVLRIEESSKKIRTKQEQESEEHVKKLVEKLIKKEESIQAFQERQRQELKKKQKEIKEKNDRLMHHQFDLDQQYNDKMNDINERFRKVQENLQTKKEEDEKNMKIRQEATKLKILDKQENCKRKDRQIEYQRQKVLDKQKENTEKIRWLKHQKEILKKAKIEASLQSKVERERIEDAIQQLSKVTYEKGSSENLTEEQKRILKKILTPEDYEIIEAEERRKEQEKLEAEEKLKAGLISNPFGRQN